MSNKPKRAKPTTLALYAKIAEVKKMYPVRTWSRWYVKQRAIRELNRETT
jgi:uncharacterized protein YjiS (DUF1127 family)